ncbi:hypothetical protein KM043_002454 [Ampulex compressa]|nr:hypothetical protein KM043_002454 [Ampulex compressa]
MGSLLACYALTGDVMFRDKAAQLGERMLPAFQTATGIPHSLINLHTGASKNYGWASSGCSILSEIGTMHLEFTYLSDITGNPVFKSKVENVRKVLKGLDKPNGLYPNYINPRTGNWGQHHMSLGGLGDSFYEYLLKAWIQSGREDVEARQMYDAAIKAIDERMIKISPGKLLYVSDLKYDRLEHKMGHLACFAGGMFALGANTSKSELSDRYMTVAAGLTNTCHESYDRSATKLGPEAFHFIEGNEAKSLKNGEKYYILRPETFESYFIMWRLTKNPKYRQWGWEAVQALEKHCRVPGGFTGLHNVYLVDPPKDDVQQSYFFAETLKYLYLLFSDDDLINLNDWVFNSEAHVLPIRAQKDSADDAKNPGSSENREPSSSAKEIRKEEEEEGEEEKEEEEEEEEEEGRKGQEGGAKRREGRQKKKEIRQCSKSRGNGRTSVGNIGPRFRRRSAGSLAARRN